MRFQPPCLRQRADPDYCRPPRRPSTPLYLRLQWGEMNSRSATATVVDLSSGMPARRGHSRDRKNPPMWCRGHWNIFTVRFSLDLPGCVCMSASARPVWRHVRPNMRMNTERSFLKWGLGLSFGERVGKRIINKLNAKIVILSRGGEWKPAVSCSVAAEILSVYFLDVCEAYRAEITPPAFSWTNISVDVTGNRCCLWAAHFPPVHSHSTIHNSSLKSILQALLQVCVGVFRPTAIWWPRMKSNFSCSAACRLSFTPSIPFTSALHFCCLMPAVHFDIFYLRRSASGSRGSLDSRAD